jgi:hypothetical protein
MPWNKNIVDKRYMKINNMSSKCDNSFSDY